MLFVITLETDDCDEYIVQGNNLATLIHGIRVVASEVVPIDLITWVTLTGAAAAASATTTVNHDAASSLQEERVDWTCEMAQVFFDSIASLPWENLWIKHFYDFPLALLQACLERRRPGKSSYIFFDLNREIVFNTCGLSTMTTTTHDKNNNNSRSSSCCSLAPPFTGGIVHFNLDFQDTDDMEEDEMDLDVVVDWIGLKACFTHTSLGHPQSCLQGLHFAALISELEYFDYDQKTQQDCRECLEQISQVQTQSLVIKEAECSPSLVADFLRTTLQCNRHLQDLSVDIGGGDLEWLSLLQVPLQTNTTIQKLSLYCTGNNRDEITWDTWKGLETILCGGNYSITHVTCHFPHDRHSPKKITTTFTPTVQLCLAMNRNGKNQFLSTRKDKHSITSQEWLSLLRSSSSTHDLTNYYGFFNEQNVIEYEEDAIQLSCIYMILREYTSFYVSLMFWKKKKMHTQRMTAALCRHLGHLQTGNQNFVYFCNIFFFSSGGETECSRVLVVTRKVECLIS